MQVEIEVAKNKIDKKKENIADFLSKNIERVDIVKARKIVNLLKENALEVLEGNYSSLLSINGIKEKSVLKIQEGLNIYFELKEILGGTEEPKTIEDMINKVYNTLNSEAAVKIKENPYCICDKCGIDFSLADKIAVKLGLTFDNVNRIKQAIMCFITRELENRGDIFTYKYKIMQKISGFIDKISAFDNKFEEIDLELIDKAFLSLAMEGKIVEENDSEGFTCVYRADYYAIEGGIVKEVKKRLKGIGFCKSKEDVFSNKVIKNVNLNKEQEEAVLMALTNKISIITGGPGTGKTQIVNILLSYIRTIKPTATVELCSPTGKAANKLSKATKTEAKTIHRLLNLTIDDSEGERVNKVTSDFVILDEASMVDAYLFNEVLNNISVDTNLVIIGDFQQLPSVGPGSILRDLINSKIVKVTRLEKIYRQNECSLIVSNSHALVEKDNEKQNSKKSLAFDDNEFVFIDTKEEKITDKLIEIFASLISDSDLLLDDIMVLSPIKDGNLGVKKINKALQEWCQDESGYDEAHIKEQDRIVQITNNYKLGVMNGEIGELKEIYEDKDERKTYIVDFGDREVKYDCDTIAQLELAYSITVHKSQGSEYSVVIIPVGKENMTAATVNMVYTAITRAKQKIIFIGNKDILLKVINENKENMRNSRIIEKLTTK